MPDTRKRPRKALYEVTIVRELRLRATFEVDAENPDAATELASHLASEAFSDAWQEDAVLDERITSVKRL